MSTQLIPTEHDDVVAFGVDGSVESVDVDRITQVIDEKAENRETPLRLYADLREAGDISPGALLKDISAGVTHASSFDRVAIVGTEPLLAKLADIGGRLTPGVESRSFPADQREQAMAWLTH